MGTISRYMPANVRNPIQVQIPASLGGQLVEECPRRSAIPITKRMNAKYFAKIINASRNKIRTIESAQSTFPRELVEQLSAFRCNLGRVGELGRRTNIRRQRLACFRGPIRRGKQGLAAMKINDPKFSSPVVNILKQMVMDRSQMVEVEISVDRVRL